MILVSCSNTYSSAEAYEYLQLKGKVKNCTELSYHAEQIEGKWENSGLKARSTEYSTFDKDGFLQINEYLDDQMKSFIQVIPVRKHNQMVGQDIHERGELVWKIRYTEISTDTFFFEQLYPSGEKYSYGKIYKNDGRIIKRTEKMLDPEVDNCDIYEYDNNGNFISQVSTTHEFAAIDL